MKRFFGFFFIPLLAVLFVGSFGSSYASAASGYDNVIYYTDTIPFVPPDGIEIDIADDFYDYFRNHCDFLLESNDPALQQAGGACDDFEAAAASPNGAYFVISSTYGSWSGRPYVQIMWTDDQDLAQPMTFNTNCAYGGHLVFSLDLMHCDPNYDPNNPHNWRGMRIHRDRSEVLIELPTYVDGNFFGGVWSHHVGVDPNSVNNGYNYPNYYTNIYASKYRFDPPQNYEGLHPERGGVWFPEGAKTVIAPDFTYSYNDLDVTATLHPQTLPEFTPSEGYTFNGYEIDWNLWRCESGTYDDNYVCSGSSEIVEGSYKIQDPSDDYTFTLPEHGEYILEARYLVQQCYRYASYPATPDYCFYADLNAAFDGAYSFERREVLLEIDGSSGSGDTLDLNCFVDGMCKPDVVDCSLYDNFMQRVTCQMDQVLDFGVIGPSLVQFRQLFSSLVVSTPPTCGFDLPSLTAMGSTFSLSGLTTSACANAQKAHQAMPLIGTVLNFIFALMLLGMTVELINRVLRPRDHDIIEGVNNDPRSTR